MTFHLLAAGAAAALMTASAMAQDAETAAPETDAQTETPQAQTEDPRLWLEEVEGERALDQVREWNARTLEQLKSDPLYEELYGEALQIVNSEDKIAYPGQRGEHIYNFWQDEEAVRGLWRRTGVEDYLSGDPEWEVLIDFDQLAEEEDRNWVYKGASCAEPENRYCLISLSDGGKDAALRREFDVQTGEWVEENPFNIPTAKSGSAWLDENTLLVATDWGGTGETLTESGYPFVVKRLERGQSLDEATEVLRGDKTDVGVWPVVIHDGDKTYVAVSEADTFYETTWWMQNEAGEMVTLPIPAKSNISDIYQGQALIALQEDWAPESGGEFTSGQLVSFDLDAFLETGELGEVTAVYTPDERSALQGASVTASGVLVSATENVTGKAYLYTLGEGGDWTSRPVPLAENSVISPVSTDREKSLAFFTVENMITPSTLYAVDLASMDAQAVQSLPDWFDASTMEVEQREAESADGTMIPYFIMKPKGQAADGSNPTLLYGYGGFQVSMEPSYSALRGKLWVENGGTFVLANIRGGGEFGPDWHQAGLKTNRQVIYDDFIAVGEDLLERGVTSREHLGIMGGSNGGLLMGVMYTQRPDLWGAVVCQVPLLDMLRFHKLLAGASWVGEYGSPEIPEEREFLKSISPYHNVGEEADYPPIFFVTSTKDDRVHPGHARKMAALLEEYGHPFDYYENIDGGHSAAANLKETANRVALEYSWLWNRLNGEES